MTTALTIIIGKKLKKRLEDLEKRANTSTDESDHKATTSKHKSTKSKDSAVSKAPISPVTASRSPSDFPLQNSEPPQIGFLPYPDDRLFSEQYGARMSASPPPPAPLNIASSDMLYSTYSSNSSYSSVSAGCDPSLYAYQTPFDSPYPSPLPDMQFPKQDLFSEPDTLSVALGFAPMPHMDFQQLPQVNYPFSLPPYAQWLFEWLRQCHQSLCCLYLHSLNLPFVYILSFPSLDC